MDQILQHLIEAYKEAFKTKGVHSPITNDIRQLIFRNFQHAGQQIILSTNRELMNAPEVMVDNAVGAAEQAQKLTTFVHSKSIQNGKKPAAVLINPPKDQTPQPVKGGRLGRTERAKESMESAVNPGNQINQSSESNTSPQNGSGNPVVGDDQTATPGDETATVAAPLTEIEIAELKTLEPGQIAAKFDSARLVETMVKMNMPRPDAKTRPVKIAAMLKAAIN